MDIKLSHQPLIIPWIIALYLLYLTLQKIRHFSLWEEHVVKPTKSARQHGRDIKHRWGIPWKPPDANTTQYCQRTHKKVSNLDPTIIQCKWGVFGVEPQRGITWPPCAKWPRKTTCTVHSMCLYFHITPNITPRKWVPPNSKLSEKKVLTKPSTLPTIRRHRWGD